MPKKFFKKYLPSYESIQQNKFVGKFGKILHHHNLWYLNRRVVSGGVAAGLFAGLIPGSNPVQFFFATVLAILFKVNLPVALFVTLYSNPLTIVPIYLVAYAIGAFVTNDVANNMSWAELHLLDKNMNEWVPLIFDWLFSFGKPLLIGIFLLAVLLSVMGYFMVQGAWRLYIMYEWEKRKKRRHH